MSIEAMKMAFKVLEMYMAAGTKYPSNLLEMELAPKAYDALRQAIKQAEKQEPVAWVDVKDSCEGPYEFYGINRIKAGKHHLYTEPPQREWVELTDDEKQQILDKNTHPDGRFGSYTTTLGIINDTDTKLREKNT